MKLIFKNIFGTLCLCGVVAACSEWDDHYDAMRSLTTNSAATLWENLSSLESSQFSEFAELARRAGYDTVLTASQTYTVWAPVNGTITNLNDLMQMDSEQLRTEFIENHIAHNNYVASGQVDEVVTMLNSKVHRFSGSTSGYQLSDFNVSRANIPSSNGIIHALEGQLTFKPNIYERLDTTDERISAFARHFHSYDHSQLNLDKSTPGPVVDGEITYLDSVSDKWNSMYDRYFAYINSEDSSYTMMVPTNAAYEDALGRLRKYFNYVDHFTFRDNTSTNAQLSHETDVNIDAAYLHDSIVNRMLEKDLFFNNNVRDNRKLKAAGQLPDSLFSTMYGKLYSGNVATLFEGAQRQECSNGALYITDSLRLPDWVFWNPFIRVEAENATYRTNVTNGTAFTRWPNFDPVLYPGLPQPSAGGYVEVIPLSSTNNPEVDFYLPEVRSTTYAVYGVFVPDMTTVEADSTGQWHYSSSNPNRVRVQMGYNSETGMSVETWLGSNRGTTTYDSNPEKVDTVYFGDFTFPIAYASTGYQPYIRIESRASGNNFDRTLRIDCVLLIPKELDLYLKEHPDYELDGWGKKQNWYY